MTKKEFNAVIDDAVSNGAKRADVEAYVRAGYKVDEKADGQESLATVKAKAAAKDKNDE
ncbi:MAG: hypothetical protein H0X08_06600 [Blastocatellia bacterium]|nr:hypothetical protein [Blastocatellia bacterium]